MKRHVNSSGFTIVELMIATLVFAIVLLVMTMGVMSVGRSFHKGVISSKTQEAARAVAGEIGKSIQFSTNRVITSPNAGDGTPGFCIGNKLYSYRLHTQTEGAVKSFVSSDPDGNPGNGVLGACNGTIPALTQAAMSDPATQAQALLGENMRLSKFTVTETPLGSGVWQIVVKVAYGDGDGSGPLPDDLLNHDNANSNCSNEIRASQFCATAEITSYVQRRLQIN